MQRVLPARGGAAAPPKPVEAPKKSDKTNNFKELLALLGAEPRALAAPKEPPGKLAEAPPAETPVAGTTNERPLTTDADDGRGAGEGDAEADGAPCPLESTEAPDGMVDGVVDPLMRSLAHAGPRVAPPEPAAPPPANASLPELEQLLQRLVRRAAWGGDGRRGSARLEIGAGPLEGATLLVQAEGGEVSVDLELPPGADAEPWRARLRERLEARGLSVRELSVR